MKMKKLLLGTSICLLIIIPVLGTAQQTGASDAPDKADVIKFLDLMHARDQMVQVMANMSKQMRAGGEESFKAKVPNATPEQLAKVDKLFDTIVGSLPVDEVVDAIVPIYQKHLTKADLAAVTAFYSSPAGQKILKELPAIMSESIQAGAEIGRRALTNKSQELDQQMAELVKEAQKQ
jgi:hypothetical protein